MMVILVGPRHLGCVQAYIRTEIVNLKAGDKTTTISPYDTNTDPENASSCMLNFMHTIPSECNNNIPKRSYKICVCILLTSKSRS